MEYHRMRILTFGTMVVIFILRLHNNNDILLIVIALWRVVSELGGGKPYFFTLSISITTIIS